MELARKNLNLPIGVALALGVVLVCSFVTALFDSRAGEIAGALASLIAGLLALLAGVLAFLIGRRQVEWLQRSEKRHLARETLIATRLIDSVLARIQDEIKCVRKMLSQRQYQPPDAVAPSDVRKLLHKPNVAVVWDRLGLCDPEIIRAYMDLDADIDQYWEREIHGVAHHIEQLQKFDAKIEFLRDELGHEARRCTKALAET
jgi:hypothetical protein